MITSFGCEVNREIGVDGVASVAMLICTLVNKEALQIIDIYYIYIDHAWERNLDRLI